MGWELRGWSTGEVDGWMAGHGDLFDPDATLCSQERFADSLSLVDKRSALNHSEK